MSTIQDAIKDYNEKLIDTWTLNCLPFNGGAGKFLGKLHVTDKSLYFEAQFDSSLTGLAKSVAVSAVVASGHALIVSQEIMQQWESKGFLTIPKGEIKAIKSKSSFFKKTVTVILKDDSEHLFDYGMLSVKALEAAIRG